MRPTFAVGMTLSLALSAGITSGPRVPPHTKAPAARANANTAPAGTLTNGVLTLALDVKRATWYPNGDSLPGIEVAAFADESGVARVPGPLVRVPAGTTVRLSVRNTFERDTVAFYLPPEAHGALTSTAADSLVLPPGDRAEVQFVATTPGNYLYRARTNDTLARTLQVGGLMAGAIVIDSAGVSPPRDRVMVLLAYADSAVNGTPAGNPVFSINGRAWPNTERLAVTVGDTLHWRVINANNDVHPMHLHGFYYRVDALTGPVVRREGMGTPAGMVVTQRMTPFSAMSLTWVPERAGNWLFHCHFQIHVARPPAPNASMHENHALTGMQGLVMGIVVKPRPGAQPEKPGATLAPRKLRLVAVQDSEFPARAPSMRFLLEDPRAAAAPSGVRPGFSPPIVLERDTPVSIMVVNRLREPTAVHWHGMELDSYYDGVAGFGGAGTRISPIIAPSDSFEARFTPPRAGTFIYHSHVNEPVQHRAGLLGALIVVDQALGAAGDDQTFFLKSSLAGAGAVPVLDINGQADPDTVVLHIGRPARLRFISLALLNPNARVILTARADSAAVLTADSLVVSWRPLAKDGADLPPEARVARSARQIIGMGETYDFEFTPTARGILRMEVRGGGPGALLGRVPIRVE